VRECQSDVVVVVVVVGGVEGGLKSPLIHAHSSRDTKTTSAPRRECAGSIAFNGSKGRRIATGVSRRRNRHTFFPPSLWGAINISIKMGSPGYKQAAPARGQRGEKEEEEERSDWRVKSSKLARG